MAKVRTIDAFMNGKIFIKAVTPKANVELMKQLVEEDCEAVDKCDKDYVADFGKNMYNPAYYFTYYKKQHALKVMCEDFFNKIYNTGVKPPYIIEM